MGYYLSYGGFSYIPAMKSNPDYLVKYMKEDRLKQIKEELKKSSEKSFSPKNKELEKTKTLGSPENLVRPDNEDEQD